MNLTKNIGEKDRTIRLVVGILLVAWGVIGHNAMIFLGIVLLATVYFGICPAYAFLGMSTKSKGEGTTGRGEP